MITCVQSGANGTLAFFTDPLKESVNFSAHSETVVTK
jgi:hypothetical protein